MFPDISELVTVRVPPPSTKAELEMPPPEPLVWPLAPEVFSDISELVTVRVLL